MDQCFYCLSDNVDTQSCPDCGIRSCQQHSTLHRPPETSVCLPVRVCLDGKRGRVLRATRNINEGEIVILDRAIVIIPDDKLVCLVCYKGLDYSNCGNCPKCNLPVCDKQPCLSPPESSFHSRLECQVFSSNKNAFPGSESLRQNETVSQFLYHSIGILRMVLIWKEDPKGVGREIERLQSHWNERKQDDKVTLGLTKVTTFLQRLMEQSPLCSSDSELCKMVQHAYGAVNTNATGFLGRHSSAVYPVVAVASHSCCPNLEPMPQLDRQFGFKAKRNIAAGEECTIRYTSTVTHRLELREALKRQWFFECECDRCSDPTDLGSFMSSIRCENCQDWIVPEHPLDSNSDWICHGDCGCPGRMTRESILRWENSVEKMADKEAKFEDLEKLSSAIDDLAREGRLHPNHHQVVRMKHLFLDRWMASGGSGSAECCKIAVHFSGDLLDFYGLIDPGKTEVKTRLLALRAAAALKLKWAEREKQLKRQGHH